jgi:transcription elongation factor Elf1
MKPSVAYSLWRNMEGKEKVSKASVNYRESDGRRVCGSCDMFYLASPLVGSCELVRGVIEFADVCNEWVRTGSKRKGRDKPYQDLDEPKSTGG